MKTTMMALMIAAVTAGTAFAEQGDDGGQRHKGKSWGDDSGGKQAWGQRDERDQDRGRGDRQEWKQEQRGGDEGRPGGPLSPAQMEQMRADHKAIRDLGEDARAETDETKKAELVSQLRAKLGEVADRMQAHQELRLAQAEERLGGLKEKIEYGKTHRDDLIEEQVQRILSGERPQRHPDAFKDHPFAKGGMQHGGMPPPAEGDEMAPPAEDMPPPPME